MTQKEYKVGDEVLVRTKIIGLSNNASAPYIIHDYYSPPITIALSPDQIYSLAPEFNPGEEIEVRQGENCEWIRAFFKGYIEGLSYPYIVVKPDSEKTFSFSDARKIQPKEVIDKTEEDITVIRNGKKYKLVEIE